MDNKDKTPREIFAEKYNLTKEDDFYLHKQSGKWLIKHDPCEKIHGIEKMSKPSSYVITDDNEKGTFMLITVEQGDLEGEDVGDATPQNCVSKYYRSMAFKRGVDRCVLKLLKAYELFYSDAEIEPTITQKVNKQQKSENDLDNHGK